MSGYEVNAIRWVPGEVVGAQLVLRYLKEDGFASRWNEDKDCLGKGKGGDAG
jgi:hypothetical protein